MMKAGFRTCVPTGWVSGKDKAQWGITWCQEVSKHMNTPMKENARPGGFFLEIWERGGCLMGVHLSLKQTWVECHSEDTTLPHHQRKYNKRMSL